MTEKDKHLPEYSHADINVVKPPVTQSAYL